MRAARAFRALLGLLPPTVPAEERDEIASTFAALYQDASTPTRRLRVLLASFGRLPALLAMEWAEHLSRRRARTRRKGDRMHGWGSAVWHAARSLGRSPAFTWSVVLLLGLGVGAVTSIFSVVDHVVLRPLPYPAADRLVEVQNGSHTGPTFERLAAMDAVESAAGISVDDANLTGVDEPLRLREARITREYFSMFGARPALGRLFVAEDFEGAGTVVLSHGTWRRVFGGDSAVVGETLRLNDVPRVVIGVLDSSFVAPEALHGGEGDVWRPVDWTEEIFRDESYWVLSVAARLKGGVTLARAQAEADAVAAARAESEPDYFRDDDGRPLPLPVVPLQEATVGPAGAGLNVIFAAATLLLLVACVNVAHLFMARGVERKREMAVRRALGAGTSTIARQLATESVLVGLAGAALGAGMAIATVRGFRALAPGSLPRMDTIAVDPRVLAFAVGVGLVTALAFGLLPALRLSVRGRENPLRLATRGSTGSRRAHSARHALVVAEIALSLVLAAQAGWLIRGFAELHAVELGFRTDAVWTMPLVPTGIEDPGELDRRMEAVRASLASVPGVRAASYGMTAPLQYTGGSSCCWRTSPDFEPDDEERRVAMHPVEAGYFDLFRLRVLAGRPWTRDEAGTAAGGEGVAVAPPAVISEALAVDVFGAAARALGQTMEVSNTTYAIVGVVADNRHYGPDRDVGLAAYVPPTTMAFPLSRVTMAVVTEGEQAGLPRTLARAVWRVEPDLPVPAVRSMEEMAAAATARARFVSALFSVFGAVALLLMSGGLAGTLLYMVRIRRRELGTRLALGATPAGIERSVLGRGLALALMGVAFGGLGAWAAARLMEGVVVGLEARGAGTFAVSVAVLMTVALLSSWLPARRAGKADPMEALRAE